MATLENYKGSIDLISGLRAKNNGDFPLMEAHDIVVDSEGTRLDEKLASIGTGGGSSGGGSSTAIIEVSELPTENINAEAFYKLLTASFYLAARKEEPSAMRCIIVDSLPSEGEPAYTTSPASVVAYYNKADGGVYGYVTSALAEVFTALGMSVSVGWYPAATLFSALGKSYGGVITSLESAVDFESYYVLIEESTYSYDSVTAKWRTVVQTTDEEKGLALKHKKFASFDEMMRFCTKVIPFRVFSRTGGIIRFVANGVGNSGSVQGVIDTIIVVFHSTNSSNYYEITLLCRHIDHQAVYLNYYVYDDKIELNEGRAVIGGDDQPITEVDTSYFTDLDLYYFE